MAVLFFNTDNFAELHILLATEFFCNTLPDQTLTGSLQKCVSDSIEKLLEKLLFARETTYLKI